MPPQPVRTAITFLLFLHFFALAVGVTSNWSYRSPLETALRNVPGLRPYLGLLGMDLSYMQRYRLTYAEPQDADHSVEVDLQLADGTQRQIVLPEAGLFPPQRRQHYVRLVTAAAEMSEDQNLQSILPQAIASHLLAKYEARGGTFRSRRNFLQSSDGVAAAGDSPPAYSSSSTIYEARILKAGGQVQLLKVEAASDVAAPADAAGTTNPGSTTNPATSAEQGSPRP